jgi:hypothetical protein
MHLPIPETNHQQNGIGNIYEDEFLDCPEGFGGGMSVERRGCHSQ